VGTIRRIICTCELLLGFIADQLLDDDLKNDPGMSQAMELRAVLLSRLGQRLAACAPIGKLGQLT
jgi:hypothetical protein